MNASQTTPILLTLFIASITLVALAASRWQDKPIPPGGTQVDSLVSSSGPVTQSTEQGATTSPQPIDDTPAVHPLDPLLAIAADIKQHIERDVHDYTAKLIKRERIKGSLGDETQMLIKVRNQRETEEQTIPLSAYIKFTSPKSVAGREVIWVAGRNDNHLISHESGFLNLKRLSLAPNGILAMMGNKYPITEVGLLRLAEKLIEKGERDRELGSCIVETIEDQMVGDRVCRLYQITHPRAANGFDFHIAQIFVDVQRNIPLRYAAFMWPEKPGESPPLEEEYTYLDLQLNVGLTDADFDPDNASYDFP
ncbi:MAG: DUF1571 domain-containing protein [Pirellulaceae bacterium]